jgi:hypothetical protein
MRLAMLYALLDGSSTVEEEHLRAALAVWDYCEASARHLFGKGCNNTGTQTQLVEDPLAVRLLNAITAQPVPEERPGRWVVKVGEIPPRADGSLIPPMGLPEVVEAVRGLGARFAWMDGAVLVVAPQPMPGAVAAAVAEHQDDLRLLVPQPKPDQASVPDRDDPFIRRLLAIGTEEERERERRETLEPLRRVFAKDGVEFPPAPRRLATP